MLAIESDFSQVLQARVLDFQRKFLEAGRFSCEWYVEIEFVWMLHSASKYIELSQLASVGVPEEDVIEALKNAVGLFFFTEVKRFLSKRR